MRPLGILCLAILLASAGAVEAKKQFALDENGSRPGGYRITSLSRGIDSFTWPDVFHRGAFSAEGKDIKATNIGLEVGMQDGKTLLLVREWSVSEEKFLVIGDASNLDDMRPLPGVTIQAWQEWDMLSLAWRLKVEYAPGFQPRTFQGKVLDLATSMARLLEGIRTGGGTESADNMKVLVSFVANCWWNPANTLKDKSDVQTELAAARALYLTPVAQAATGLDPQKRRALAQANAEVLDGAQEIRDYYLKSDNDWVGPKVREFLQMLAKELADLQEALEK
jgi:hypothetical protein